MTPAAAVEQARERTVRVTELLDAWPVLSAEERLEGLRLLPHADAEDLLLSLPARDQSELILQTSAGERRSWMRLLPPDDAADVIQASPGTERESLLAVLDEPTRKEVAALLAYKEDEAGGLMNPRYARLRPDMSVDEAITYLRRQARERLETIYYVYVVQEEATEDIQKFGGMEALDAPYLDIGFWTMVRKRGGWLSALFLSEMLTATAMGRFQDEIARAVILALGGILAGLGFSRILLWQTIFHGMYGQHYLLIAFTVASSLLGVVTWGTLAGSMLPLVLR